MKTGDMDYEKVHELFRALGARGVEYVVVGAVALGLNGLVRATNDVDLFVRPTPENLDRLRMALSDVWADPAISEIANEDLADEGGIVSYVPPAGEITVDLISRLGSAFGFDDIEWEELNAGGISVRVATPGMLLRMKRDTLRPQDAADAHALRERFGLGDA